MSNTAAAGSVASFSIGPAAFALRLLPGGFGAEVIGLAVRDVDDGNFPAIHEAFQFGTSYVSIRESSCGGLFQTGILLRRTP